MSAPSPQLPVPALGVLDWIQRFVVGLELCPFAAQPLSQGAIHIAVESGSVESVLEGVAREAEALMARDASSGATSVIVMCKEDGAASVARTFEDYLDVLGLAEDLLDALGYAGRVQIASFHPQYCFADADKDDPANWSNRSPQPLLHLLREDVVSQALEHYPDAEGVPDRNIARLRALGIEGIQRTLGTDTVSVD